jgi:hypothetical protein
MTKAEKFASLLHADVLDVSRLKQVLDFFNGQSRVDVCEHGFFADLGDDTIVLHSWQEGRVWTKTYPNHNTFAEAITKLTAEEDPLVLALVEAAYKKNEEVTRSMVALMRTTIGDFITTELSGSTPKKMVN